MRKDGLFQGTLVMRDQFDRPHKIYRYGHSEKEVQSLLKDALAQGTPGPADHRTVNDLFEYFLAENGWFERSDTMEANTVADYRGLWRNHVKERVGSIRLKHLRSVAFDEVAQQMRRSGKKPNTIRNMANMVKRVLREARRQEWLPDSFTVDLEPVTVPRYQANILTLDEIEQVASQAGEYGAAVLIAGVCGLRSAEICGLTWHDVAGGLITVSKQFRPKPGGGHELKEGTKGRKGSNKSRQLPIVPLIARALEGLPKRSLYLFPDPKDDGKPINIYDMRLVVQQAMVAAGVTKVRVHDLRHSAGNALKQAGVDDRTISDILGHSTTQITRDIYLQTKREEMEKALGKIV